MTHTVVAGRTGEVCPHPEGIEIFCPKHPWNSYWITFKSTIGCCSECGEQTTEWHRFISNEYLS